jgi:hypothetical protein
MSYLWKTIVALITGLLCMTFVSCRSNRHYFYNNPPGIGQADSLVIRDFAVCHFAHYFYPVRWEADADSVMGLFMEQLGNKHPVYRDPTGINRCDSAFFLQNPLLRYWKIDHGIVRGMAGKDSGTVYLIPIIYIRYMDSTVASGGGFGGVGGYQATALSISLFGYLNGQAIFYRHAFGGVSTDPLEDVPIVSEAVWEKVMTELLQDFTLGAEPWQGRKRKRK